MPDAPVADDDSDPLAEERARLDAIDEEILDLLAERGDVVQRVAEKKVERGLPVYVAGREKEKTDAFRQKAEARGLDPDWAEDFLRMVMAASRARQSGSGAFPRATPEAQDVLIVGAEGGMGSRYAEVFERSGHHVHGIDQDDWDALPALAPGLDLALVAVPIRVTEAVIRRLAEALSPQTVLADFTSTKSEPVAAMLDAHGGPVMGLHPMHGPDAGQLSRQLMVACPAREAEASAWLLEQCRLWGMRVEEADPAEHDRVMHLVQGLRHFVALLHGSFMREADLNPGDMLAFSSPVYRAELMMNGRLFAQDAELYADIVFAGAERRRQLLRFFDQHERLAELVRADDKAGFIEEFEAIADFFGDFAPQARRESEYLITRLADRFA
jgi:chorismate mutase/prephenate dehydrogenase